MKLVEFKSNWEMLLASVCIALFGLLAIYFSSSTFDLFWIQSEGLQILTRNFGSLLFVSVAMNLMWQLYGKRAFLDEILAKAQISKEITFAGLTKITTKFHKEIDWHEYFSTVTKLDIFFAYGKTWRNTYIQELKKVASSRGARIRVILPDYNDSATITELSKRFQYTVEDTKKYIKEAEEFIIKLKEGSTEGAKIEIWLMPAAPVFSFYRFDGIAIFALYSHRPDRVQIPTFVCESGGTLYEFLYQEFKTLISTDGLAKQIYP